jgi:hypothetical protein
MGTKGESTMAKKDATSGKKDLASQLKGERQPHTEEIVKKWSQLVAQVWADEKLKGRLIEDPAAVLREHGIPTYSGVELRVVENTAEVYHLVLPLKPAADVTQLTSTLLRVAAGVAWFSSSTFCTQPRPCPPIDIGPAMWPLPCKPE